MFKNTKPPGQSVISPNSSQQATRSIRISITLIILRVIITYPYFEHIFLAHISSLYPSDVTKWHLLYQNTSPRVMLTTLLSMAALEFVIMKSCDVIKWQLSWHHDAKTLGPPAWVTIMTEHPSIDPSRRWFPGINTVGCVSILAGFGDQFLG